MLLQASTTKKKNPSELDLESEKATQSILHVHSPSWVFRNTHTATHLPHNVPELHPPETTTFTPRPGACFQAVL